MPDFLIRPLDFSEIDLAWPLASASACAASPLGWKMFAEKLLKRGGGIIVACAEDGCLHGIASYEAKNCKRGGRVLKVEALAAFELNRKAPVRRALCNALSRFARSSNCGSLRIRVPNQGFVEHAPSDCAQEALGNQG